MFTPRINTFQSMLALLIKVLLIHSTSSICKRTLLDVGIREHDKQIILNTHNMLRQVVATGRIHNQPPASNMVQLSWNDDLARKAQEWATTCAPYVHDPGRHQGNFLVGQNVATKWTKPAPKTYSEMQPDWYNDAIAKWFNEYIMYTFKQVLTRATGHYTQLIWAETTMIGCGYAYYVDELERYTKKYVCNYGPSGNVQGESPYQKGYPNCFNYGMIGSRTYPGLCVTGLVSTKYDTEYHGYNNKDYCTLTNNNYRGYFSDLICKVVAY